MASKREDQAIKEPPLPAWALRGAFQDLNNALWSFGDYVTRDHQRIITSIRMGRWYWWRRWYYEIREQRRYHAFMRSCPELRRPS